MATEPLILISDDDEQVARSLERGARRLGLRCLIDTSSEVVSLAVEHQPAVIVLDVCQRLDGRDLLAALKRDPRTGAIEVVVLSAREDPFTQAVCIELGANAFEAKPFDQHVLWRVARLAGCEHMNF